MKCLTCGTNMMCVNDYMWSDGHLDVERCPRCNSMALIEYNSEGFKVEVSWKREYNKWTKFEDEMLEKKMRGELQ